MLLFWTLPKHKRKVLSTIILTVNSFHFRKVHLFLFIYLFVWLVGFSRQGFFVALEPVLELALADQAGLELTEIRLPLPPEHWD